MTGALSAAQRRAVDALLVAGRIRSVPADAGRASDFLAQADERLSQLPLLSSDPVKSPERRDRSYASSATSFTTTGVRAATAPPTARLTMLVA